MSLKKKHSAGKDPDRNFTRGRFLAKGFFKLVRWSLVIAYLSFVIRGWYLSFSKFNKHSTSISLIKNESEMELYPSITFCPMFKKVVDITNQVLDQQSLSTCRNRCGFNLDYDMDCQCFDNCDNNCCPDYEGLCTGNNTSKPSTDATLTVDDIDMDGRIDEWSWRREDFLTFFSHPEFGDPRTALFMLHNDSYWTETVPHQRESGKCFTYDPPFESHGGFWYGMRFGLKLPDYADMPEMDKMRMLKERLHIFVHQRGKFLFYTQDDYPGSVKLDMSWIRYQQASSVTLKYVTTSSLNLDERPCTDNPNYDLAKCVDVDFSRRRGCQAPWHFYNDSNIPLCTGVQKTKQLFYRWANDLSSSNYDRSSMSPKEVTELTSCPLPCVTTEIIPHYSYDIINVHHYLKYMELGADWVVHLWFKNFMFTYESEYMVCDSTCLLGEIGGTLGFFLGGSILMFSDILLQKMQENLLK